MQHDAEALSIAHALFPDQPRATPFFLNSVRKLFAHLLRFHPTPEQLVEWMSDASQIDQQVQGTPYAATVRQSAPGQREGALGTMNNVADTIRLLKTEKDAKERWTAREWVKRRQGWIFLTSTPETRDALKPLHSLWLDLLILRLLHQADDPTVSRVWMVLDELATLQRLPQLPTDVTQGRKANIRLVLGLQGRSQLETLYGGQAEVMLSQPMTKVFMRTSEPDAANWISRSIGEVEIMRLEETHTQNIPLFFERLHRSKSQHWQLRTEPLVMASTIEGLPT